jgi:hypothetical protein
MPDNGRKDALLGMPHGTACNKLRKTLLFMYVTAAGHGYCFRCSKRIERVEHLSIEHKAPWLSSVNPRVAFFDLDKHVSVLRIADGTDPFRGSSSKREWPVAPGNRA